MYLFTYFLAVLIVAGTGFLSRAIINLIQAAFEKFIGSFKLVVHVVQNRHAGNQATHRHKTKKELTSSEFPLFVFSQ